MGYRTGQGGEGHNKHAGSNGGFQLIAHDAGENQQHHHAAAGADEAADKANDHAADHGLDSPLFGVGLSHGLLGGHDGTDNELDAKQKGHKHREAAHGGRGHQTCDVTAHHGEEQHAEHHNQAVFDVQIFVFMVGVGGDSAGQHIGGQSDANGHVGIHPQEGDEHGADHRGGTHARKACAQACAHAGEKGYDNCQQQFHCFSSSRI